MLPQAHQRELSLLEIGGDPHRVRNHRHHLRLRRDIAADVDRAVDDLASDRRDNAQIAEGDVGRRDARLGGFTLRLRRGDPLARHRDVGVGSVDLTPSGGGRGGPPDISQRLIELRAGDRARVEAEQRLVTRQVLLSLDRVGLGRERIGHGLRALRLRRDDLSLRLRDPGVGLTDRGLRFVARCLRPRRLDLCEEFARRDVQIVFVRHEIQPSRHLRGQPDDMRVDERVVGRFELAHVQPIQHAAGDRGGKPYDQDDPKQRPLEQARLLGLAVAPRIPSLGSASLTSDFLTLLDRAFSSGFASPGFARLSRGLS